ncbi:MAG: 4Fe-4S binding protein [Deltaproteobacteria bacterium]|nr:4Fe-4S binding protein [Deltaproteobacteria bacterium]MBW2138202.1 4Fe-4S binding protein [Deltaproteobacteria bacterium]
MAAPKKKKKIIIDTELCKGCRICIAFCQEKVLELDDFEKAVVRHPDQCDGCGMCELRCPDLAIELQ